MDNVPVPLTAKQPQSMILPSPRWTVGTVFIGLKYLPLLPQTYVLSLWPNVSVFVSSDQKLYSRTHLACPRGMLKISVELEGVGAALLDQHPFSPR